MSGKGAAKMLTVILLSSKT